MRSVATWRRSRPWADGPRRTSDVAAVLGKRLQELTVLRDRLVKEAAGILRRLNQRKWGRVWECDELLDLVAPRDELAMLCDAHSVGAAVYIFCRKNPPFWGSSALYCACHE